MAIEIQTVLSRNMTLVYDSLDLQAIDSGQLRGLVDDETKPMLMDTPDMIVAVYPPQPTVIQIGDRRVRITLPQPSEDVSTVPLWEIAIKCNQLIPRSKSSLVAYGFNYDVLAALSGANAHQVTTDLFVANPEKIEEALDAQLLFLVPRLKFQRGHTRYDLILEPPDQNHVKVHLNAHFEAAGGPLPSVEQLQESFHEEFRYLVSLLPRLLEGDN